MPVEGIKTVCEGVLQCEKCKSQEMIVGVFTSKVQPTFIGCFCPNCNTPAAEISDPAEFLKTTKLSQASGPVSHEIH